MAIDDERLRDGIIIHVQVLQLRIRNAQRILDMKLAGEFRHFVVVVPTAKVQPNNLQPL